MEPHLNAAELEWVAAYRKAVDEQYPGTVLRMLLYGAEARGYLLDDNRLNLLLVTRDEAEEKAYPMELLGYSLADFVATLPFVTVWTQKEWRRQKEAGSLFQQAMEQHGVWLQ